MHRIVVFGVALIGGAALCGCGGRDEPDGYSDIGGSNPGGSDGAPSDCRTPQTGCACEVEGQGVPCGTVVGHVGDYVRCSSGTRTCRAGRWGACVGDVGVTKAAPPGGLHALGRGSAPTTCENSCDPYCSAFADTGDGLDAGSSFSSTDAGLSLAGGGASTSACTSITISAPTTTVTVTSLSSPATLPFSITFNSPSCVPVGTQATWTVNRPDLATIDGTGVLKVPGAIAGTDIMRVQAFFGSLQSNTIDVSVKVRIIASTAGEITASPANNFPAPSANVDSFYTDATRATPRPPTATTDVVTWLYPYAGTYFPRGLPSPTIMYRFTQPNDPETAPDNTVKVTLRYPAGLAATDPNVRFEYSLFALERSIVYPAPPTDAVVKYDPQVLFPAAAWNAFAQTAAGKEADIVIQRKVGANAVGPEYPRKIFFVDAVLKGTVWYQTYSSKLVTDNIWGRGSILKINPGATAPTVAVSPPNTNQCVVCHSMSTDGKFAFVNGGFSYADLGLASGTASTDPRANSSRLYDLTKPYTSALKPNVAAEYKWQSGAYNGRDRQNEYGDRFTVSAVRSDKGVVRVGVNSSHLNAGGNSTNEPFYFPAYSNFWEPISAQNPANGPVSVSGWSNVAANLPVFDTTGTKLAFEFRAGTLNQSPSGTLAGQVNFRIAAVDFACNSDCTGSWAVSNARDLTPNAPNSIVSNGKKALNVAHATFTPDARAVAYGVLFKRSSISYGIQHQSTAGARGEIWMSNVPPDKNTAATPTPLRILNGFATPTTIYLPDQSRTVEPVIKKPAHIDGANPGSYYDLCQDNAGTGKNDEVTEAQLNYFPSFMPQSAGNYNWVVFTSRRMYGNLAYGSAWGNTSNQPCCETVPTKKLWIAAVDKQFVPGTDPSHPAFYLPGQELNAGNSDARWVEEPCKDEGGACDETGDCCQAPAALSCHIDVGSNPVTRSCRKSSACHVLSDVCATDSDCCGSPSVQCLGGVCAGGGSGPAYATATFSRDFTAVCSAGTRIAWRNFEWRAVVPGAAYRIDFSAQTAGSSGPYGAAVPLATASATITSPSWASSPSTVDAALRGATPSQESKERLRINMTFNTDGGNTATMVAWRQLYDCVPAE